MRRDLLRSRSNKRIKTVLSGKPMKGVDVEIVDPDGAVEPDSRAQRRSGRRLFSRAGRSKSWRRNFCSRRSAWRETHSGFKIVGRISDVINVAGKKVNPAEVEAQLLRFGGVRQAVVFGRQSALRNEEVAACVVASPHVSESDLLRFCRGGLSAWQVPKQIFIMDAIPTNERGKISRRDLARRFSTTGDSSPLRRLGS